MDYETIIGVLTEKIKDQNTVIFLKDYKIEELERKINTYEAQVKTQL